MIGLVGHALAENRSLAGGWYVNGLLIRISGGF
jgi:hypothetical protein